MVSQRLFCLIPERLALETLQNIKKEGYLCFWKPALDYHSCLSTLSTYEKVKKE